MTINLFLQVLGLVLLLLAGLKIPEHSRASYGWPGLFCWFLAAMIRV